MRPVRATTRGTTDSNFSSNTNDSPGERLAERHREDRLVVGVAVVGGGELRLSQQFDRLLELRRAVFLAFTARREAHHQHVDRPVAVLVDLAIGAAPAPRDCSRSQVAWVLRQPFQYK